jgi:hypothetical protein
MLERYGDFNYILTIPAKTGIELYLKAAEKIHEKYAWDQWLTVYPNMTKENFVSFNDFLKQLKTPHRLKDRRSDEEIIRDAELILKNGRRSS